MHYCFIANSLYLFYFYKNSLIFSKLFVVYKFCEISSYSYNKELEDEIFIDTYRDDDKN